MKSVHCINKSMHVRVQALKYVSPYAVYLCVCVCASMGCTDCVSV